MSLTTVHPADTDAPILDVLAERWSTRIFDAQTPIDEEALASELEAARWAPSANNRAPPAGTGGALSFVALFLRRSSDSDSLRCCRRSDRSPHR